MPLNKNIKKVLVIGSGPGAELRRALQRDSSSANAILATMSRRGCRI